MTRVTALRATSPGRVRVELDGAHWRVLPLEAVVRAGLAAGVELDRPRARLLSRELRRLGALDAAIRFDRERQGIDVSLVEVALAALEAEEARAAAIVAREGATPRVARRLAAKGFGPETVETLFA